jgi:hypothetical protein
MQVNGLVTAANEAFNHAAQKWQHTVESARAIVQQHTQQFREVANSGIYYAVVTVWYGLQILILGLYSVILGMAVYAALYRWLVPQPSYTFPVHFFSSHLDNQELLGRPVHLMKSPQFVDLATEVPVQQIAHQCLADDDTSLLSTLLSTLTLSRLLEGSLSRRCYSLTPAEDGTHTREAIFPVGLSDFSNPTQSQWMPSALTDHELSRTSAPKRRKYKTVFGHETYLSPPSPVLDAGREYEMVLTVPFEYFPMHRGSNTKSFTIHVDLISVTTAEQGESAHQAHVGQEPEFLCQTTSDSDPSPHMSCRAQSFGSTQEQREPDVVRVTREQPQLGEDVHVVLGRCQHEIRLDDTLLGTILRSSKASIFGQAQRSAQLVCFEGFKESAEYPLRGLRIVIANPDVFVTEAAAILYTRMQGASYLLFHWYYSTAILTVAAVSAVSFGVCIALCVGLRTCCTGAPGFGVPFPYSRR